MDVILNHPAADVTKFPNDHIFFLVYATISTSARADKKALNCHMASTTDPFDERAYKVSVISAYYLLKLKINITAFLLGILSILLYCR